MTHSQASAERATRVTETVAVLGAGGAMGSAMARNITRAGLPVRAWNRSRDKAEPLERDGAVVAGTPAEAVQGATIVLTILSDADAVLSVMDGEDGALPVMARPDDPGHPIWLQMSTIGEEGTDRCVNLANRYGVGFVDAPVFGSKEPAEQAALVILESGPEEVWPRVQPVFDAIGQRTIRAGQAGAGTRLKLVTNSWVLAVVEAGAETIALAEGLGLDPRLFFQALEGGPLDLPYLRAKGELIANRDFPASFRLALAAKDANLVSESARQHGLDLPLLDLLARRLHVGAADHADEDLSATYLTSAPGRAS
ncbi:MAG TPA: NAD(P)-dependent oxidoreductase [Trebonia sp.]|nr:NAD(P)-dependent oxidoreductase [Trebonia sp.]